MNDIKRSIGEEVKEVWKQARAREIELQKAEAQALVDANNIKVAEGCGLEVSLDGGKTFVTVQARNEVVDTPTCECGAKPGELHFQFCPAYQPIRSEG